MKGVFEIQFRQIDAGYLINKKFEKSVLDLKFNASLLDINISFYVTVFSTYLIGGKSGLREKVSYTRENVF